MAVDTLNPAFSSASPLGSRFFLSGNMSMILGTNPSPFESGLTATVDQLMYNYRKSYAGIDQPA